MRNGQHGTKWSWIFPEKLSPYIGQSTGIAIEEIKSELIKQFFLA